MFILRERESESKGEHMHKWERGETEERKNPKQAPHCQSRAQCGAGSHEPRDHDLSQNQELDNWATQVPLNFIFI